MASAKPQREPGAREPVEEESSSLCWLTCFPSLGQWGSETRVLGF